MVAMEQFLEGVPVAADMRGEQFGVTERLVRPVPMCPEDPHSRTLRAPTGGVGHQFPATTLICADPGAVLGMTGQDAARSGISRTMPESILDGVSTPV